MFGINFSHDLVRKYVVIFGTLFNDIQISRTNEEGEVLQSFRVPLSYGPREKFMARLESDPNLNRPVAIQLPRMSFEITGLSYDSGRKLTTTTTYNNRRTGAQHETQYSRVYVPTPYNISFRLEVMVKNAEDGAKIVGEILPFFTPDWTVSVKLLEDLPNMVLDIPVVLDNVSQEDMYDGDFKERRVLVWTLDFTMKSYFFGPVHKAKIIKVAKVNFHNDFLSDQHPLSRVVVEPGLTADGLPTSNAAASIPYQDIKETDNYGYIVTFEDFKENW